ncbi:MAG: helix-turn-helix transcriptional regulator [Gammaproteobacteria bacterium]|nr:helix-turn-helix transcriptional regulator [Gammaproteobacteria bacterium]MDH3449898.1 helix-turn-helix transcriptional regulator [Gammaproteobacteria bacterium]
MTRAGKTRKVAGTYRDDSDHRFLGALGQRVRELRNRSGISRKSLSAAAGVSERHLANLEYGEGNPSVLVLAQIADALHCSLAELVGDFTTASPEWLMIRSLLENRDEQTLHRARQAIVQAIGSATSTDTARTRIALIGLRGAGKSTLGARLARDLGFAFIELSREIEKLAGCSIAEIQDMYGNKAYRRYERRALEETIQINRQAVIATPGGLVSDPDNFDLLLSYCTTVWLRAKPEDHMQRVIEQGDLRPMEGANEAMQDLNNILATREDFYSRASLQLDTSSQPLDDTCDALRDLVRDKLRPDTPILVHYNA